MDNNENKQEPVHYYDGIEEKNNPLPDWWLGILYLTMVFSAVYYVYFQFGGGKSIAQEYASARELYDKEHPVTTTADGVSDDALEKLASDPTALESGKKTFAAKCVACHGADGQGLIGPNLTDNFWIHGDGKPTSVLKVIRDGVPTKGMPPWGAILSATELQEVTAYARSLRGTSPANAKAPQGEEYPN